MGKDGRRHTKRSRGKINQFIIKRKEKGDPFGYLKNFYYAVNRFYQINDIDLNKKKIYRFMPEDIKVKKDRAYKDEEIRKLLSIGDERTRAVV